MSGDLRLLKLINQKLHI